MRRQILTIALLVVTALLVANAQPGVGITKTAPIAGTGSSGSPLKITACAVGENLVSNGTTWDCAAAGAGDITSVGATASGGLTGGASSGAATLGLLVTCSSTQVLKWNGSAWACADSVYTAGDGLTLTVADFDLYYTNDFTITADKLDLSTAVTAPGSVAVATTLGVTGLSTLTAGATTPANLTTTGTGDLVSGDDLTVADDAIITGDVTAAKVTSETQRHDFTRGVEQFHEFMATPAEDGGWTLAATLPTYATAGYASNRPGVVQLLTEADGVGTAATIAGFVQGDREVLTQGTSFFVSGGALSAEWALLLETTVPGATPSYEVVVGSFDEFGDTTPQDGIYCLANAASVNWQVCTSEAGTRTCADTSPVVALTANRWIKCAFAANAGGTSVVFTVTDMTSSTVGTATSGTNIPNDSGHPVGLGVQNIRLGLTGGGSVQVDYAWIKQTFTTAR